MEVNEFAKKGTTTVGIVCTDGVVMGADSRATMDTFIASTEAVKVFKIDETLGLTIAGDVGDALYLVKYLKLENELHKMEEGKPLTPRAASSLISLIFQQTKYYPYVVQLIVGGFNGKEPEIYNLDMYDGAIKEPKFFSSGSGSLAALGYLEDAYREDLRTQEAVVHTAKALQIAMKRDTATGNNIKIVSITEKGFKEYTKEEIETLVAQAEKKNIK